MNFQYLISSTPTTVLATGAVLAVLVLGFFLFFLVPGLVHLARLMKLQRRITKFGPNNYADQVKKVFGGDKRLSHLWKEYQDSLHFQREERDGQMVVRSVRATLPAEMHFNGQYVVDSRLRTEFFKHLPGLFTGIGIIGTFGGLIEGLRAFQVSENAATVRSSLESLMHSVGEAFLVSATAIGVAMLVTLLEKLLLAALYRRTEDIAHEIDARFEAGAGEEYLSRLVKSSEESASQSKILKDALVKEMGELLRELTSAQIAASKEQQSQVIESLVQASKEQLEAARQDNQTLGQTIAESIQQSLKGPLEDIASSVKTASGDQSDTAARLLHDAMAGFSQRLNDLFTGQISGLNDLNKRTAEGIQDAVQALHVLVSKMEASGERSANEMANRMAQAVAQMEQRQSVMNEQSAAFAEQIRKLVSASQAETKQELQSTLQAIGTQMASMLERLNASQADVFERNRVREEAMAERAQGAVSSMADSVAGVGDELKKAAAQMAQSVSTLSQTTATSVEKMNTGAELLGAASRNFASAGERVSETMGHAATLSAKLTETSGSLRSGASAIQDLLGDYRTQRDAVGALVTELRGAVEAARREASLTTDVLARIEGSATRLGTAQKLADEYLDGVSKVLGEAHSSFAQEVKRTLDKANTEFHTKLTQAVGLLSSAVGELELTLAAMGSLTPVKR